MFARGLVQRLGASPVGKSTRQVGPYTLPWDRGDDEDVAEMAARVGLGDQPPDAVVSTTDIRIGTSGAERALGRWVGRQRRLKDISKFSVRELRERMKRIIQQIRVRGGSRRLFLALTVHQAKNQEFDNVIVLWPYEIAGGYEKERRLLYNAVTRARRRAIVIVQNNTSRRDRLTEPPFVAATIGVEQPAAGSSRAAPAAKHDIARPSRIRVSGADPE
jgi:hypothetical protein